MAVGKINNEKVTMLFDFGADISSINTTFAGKVRCVIDKSRTQEWVGIGEKCLHDGGTNQDQGHFGRIVRLLL